MREGQKGRWKERVKEKRICEGRRREDMKREKDMGKEKRRREGCRR